MAANNEPVLLDSMNYEHCQESAQFLLKKTKCRPKIAIICGSGLSSLGDAVESAEVVAYSEIPHFPSSTAPGHRSRMLFGRLGGVEVMLMQGRFHLYEGYNVGTCAMPVRVMHLMGVTKIMVSNAAGALSDHLKVGDVMAIKDHLNLQGFVGVSPLAGLHEKFGARFFAMNHAYSPVWRKHFHSVAAELGHGAVAKEGVYVLMGGPQFETPAELRMLKLCGVDAVGMSTVHEVVTARQCGMSVFAFSLITNVCVVDDAVGAEEGASVEEVMGAAAAREKLLKDVVTRMAQIMSKEK